MNLPLKINRLLRLVGLVGSSLILAVSFMLFRGGTVWNQYDFKALDFFYRGAVARGLGPRQSPDVVIAAISDKTYDHFGKNVLDRGRLAELNVALAGLDPTAVAYDLIFARPSNPESDREFAASIRRLGSVYLPIGLACSDDPVPFRWEYGSAYERFQNDYLRKPREEGTGKPFFGARAVMQSDDFAKAAHNSGHISVFNDPDAVYRHVVMLVKVGDSYFPTLSLSMFLDYAGVPLEKLVVEWGRRIVIPAGKGSLLKKDVIIPIDERGRAFIPFPQTWDRSFKKMEGVTILQRMEDKNLRGNLTEFFEGKFVFVGDISVGSSDLGQTPLEDQAPLILIHASMLNGMLANRFYTRWSLLETATLVWILSAVLLLSAMPRSSLWLYGTGIAVAGFVPGLAWLQFIQFSLFPVVTVGGSVLAVFAGLVIALELAVGKERAFIKRAFSRYVPAQVVDALVSKPEMLKLGGEERVMTVLFSDLADFTRISEMTPPARLVSLLNEYLTEMTDIVLDHGGIIDKFEGDAIMAEFGAPLPMPDHAAMAVRTGLRMQERLKELRDIWSGRGLPALRCRIGINTGSMIVGNMGSNQVFDYTVLGDSVNLASRLEGANKMYGTYLMISEFTLRYLPVGAFRMRPLDVVKVKGKSQAVKVYEVYGEAASPVDDAEEAYYIAYCEAFDLYLARDLKNAAMGFKATLEMRPGDPASDGMIARIDKLAGVELPPDWDGSVTLTAK